MHKKHSGRFFVGRLLVSVHLATNSLVSARFGLFSLQNNIQRRSQSASCSCTETKLTTKGLTEDGDVPLPV
jgi:hypothetical protein